MRVPARSLAWCSTCVTAQLGDERTSISLALPKAADATLRAIESRAAELVGLPSDHVEPLQVVYYSEGARFDLHHDVRAAATLNEPDLDRCSYADSAVRLH